MKYQTDVDGFILCTNAIGKEKYLSPQLIEMAFKSGKPKTYLKGFAPLAPLEDDIDLIDVVVKEEVVKTAEVVTETVNEPISNFDFVEENIPNGKSEINRLLALGYNKKDIEELTKDVEKKGIINFVKELT